MFLKPIQFISTIIQILPISYLFHNWQICITFNSFVYYINNKTVFQIDGHFMCNSNS